MHSQLILIDRVEKSLRKLLKSLEDFPAHPRPSYVHELRSQIRRLQAALAIPRVAHSHRAQSLGKEIEPIREASSRLRDTDVMFEKVLSLSQSANPDALIELLTYIAQVRDKNEHRLCRAVDRHGKTVRKNLKEELALIASLREGGSRRDKLSMSPGTLQSRVAQIRHEQDLDENNLHSFRIQVKELRYLMQLGSEPDTKRLENLKSVANAIGEWHDWAKLAKFAEKSLHPKRSIALLQRISATREGKLRVALSAGAALRRSQVETAA